MVATLDMLSFREVDTLASSTLLSRNPAQRSDSDSLPPADMGSVKNSELSAGELGVRWKGEVGSRRVLPEVPGRASPACSFCSSVQFSRPAMIWRIWNFLGSDRSRATNWRKWLVTTCLSSHCVLVPAREEGHECAGTVCPCLVTNSK